MQFKSELQKKIFDKKYYDYYTREETIETFRQCVAVRKRKRTRQHTPYIIINDGVKTKKADPDLPIPEGWQRGFIKKGKRYE